jgi:IS1 family transposase
MEQIPLWKELGALGVGGMIAGIIFFFYQKREKEHKELLMELLKEKTMQMEMLMSTLRENSAVIAKHTTVLDALHRRLDGELNHHREHER